VPVAVHGSRPPLRPLARGSAHFYNRSLYASDHAEPVYRHAIVAAFEGAPLPSPEAVLPAAPVAPQGALEPFHDLQAELLAFDRERGAWRTERDRLRKVIEDLRGDLQGHQGTLAELREELDASRRHGEALQATLADEREQAAGVRAELQALADANLGTARALEADLGRVETGARQIQKDLLAANAAAEALNAVVVQREAELAELREELHASAVRASHLHGELDAARAQAERLSLEKAGLREHLEAVQREAAALRRDREALTAQVHALQATLRRRWHNLKRALDPRRPSPPGAAEPPPPTA
jgi:chromosome segregation ATPase